MTVSTDFLLVIVVCCLSDISNLLHICIGPIMGLVKFTKVIEAQILHYFTMNTIHTLYM